MTDDETKELERRLSALRTLYRDAFGPRTEGLTIEQREKILTDRLNKELGRLNQRLEMADKLTGRRDIRITDKGTYLLDNDEMVSLKAEIKKTKASIEKAQEAANPELYATRRLDRRIAAIGRSANRFKAMLAKGEIEHLRDDVSYLRNERLRTAWQEKQKLMKQWRDMKERLEFEKMTKGRKIYEAAKGLRDLFRTYQASGDASGIGVQSAWFALMRPGQALKQLLPSIRAMFDKEFADRQIQRILEDPDALIILKRMRVKLPLAENALGTQEEVFGVNYATKRAFQKVGLGVVADNAFLRASERGFGHAVMAFRYSLAKEFLDTIREQKGSLENVTPEEFRQMGRYVNMATGAGDFFGNEQLRSGLGSILWAPGRVSAQIQQVLMPLDYLNSRHEMSDVVKDKVKWEYFAKPWIRIAVILGLSYLLNELCKGDDDDDDDFIIVDPRDARFGRIRMGDQWYSIMGNDESYIRLFAQGLTGTAINAQGVKSDLTKSYGQNFFGKAANMLRGKLRPDIALALDLFNRKDMIGRPIERRLVAKGSGVGLIPFVVRDHLRPMSLGDVWDVLFKSDASWALKPVMATAAFYGVTGQDYGWTEFKQAKANYEKLKTDLGESSTLTQQEKLALLRKPGNARANAMKKILNKKLDEISSIEKTLRDNPGEIQSYAEGRRMAKELEQKQEEFMKLIDPGRK